MKKYAAFVSVLMPIFLAGCVSTANVAIPKEGLGRLAGATIAVSSRERPDFSVLTPAGAMGGFVGGAVGGAISAAASASSGNEMATRYDLQDPAPAIAKDLSAYLTKRFKMVQPDGAPIAIKTMDTNEIASAATGRAELILDVQTVSWMCAYLPLNWKRYRVIYTVKLRLIDVKNHEMIAEGFFSWKTPSGAPNPTYGELFDNDAEGLRAQFAQARTAAIDYFNTEILSEKG